MKANIASISFDHFFIQAGGKTREEAIRNCIEKLRKHIACDVIDTDTGFRLPEGVFASMPQTLPDGCVRVCLVRHSHSGGGAYDWRHVAVPKGSQIRVPGGHKSHKIVKDVKISFADCNGDYYYGLPQGSYLWQEDAWVAAERVEYDY